jgi:3-deoxy-manno-octulosonate cytidylyltransferase (CMP-KDO synthetase)
MAKVVIIIPARYGSTRFPGKPLVPIMGAQGRSAPLIQRTWEVAADAKYAHGVYIATDDERIRNLAEAFGAAVVMTDGNLLNGTERAAQAATRLDLAPDDIVINLQGDALLTPTAYVDALISHMNTSPGSKVTTAIYPRGYDEARVPGEVTAVTDSQFKALYFTRSKLPQLPDVSRYQHVGVYGYRVAALRFYERQEPSPYEQAEALEQLRFIENGMPIQCVQPLLRRPPAREVNYPEDIEPVQEELRKWNIE